MFVARGRMPPSVRPRYDGEPPLGPYGSSRTGSTSKRRARGTLVHTGSPDPVSPSHVVLLPLYVRLDVGGRNQTHCVTSLAELTRPVVRSGTGLHRYYAGWLSGKKPEERRSRDPLAKYNPAASIGPVGLENPFRDVQSDRASLSHGRLLMWLVNAATLALRCRQGASTPSMALRCRPTMR